MDNLQCDLYHWRAPREGTKISYSVLRDIVPIWEGRQVKESIFSFPRSAVSFQAAEFEEPQSMSKRTPRDARHATQYPPSEVVVHEGFLGSS